jgi:hypothetical protein
LTALAMLALPLLPVPARAQSPAQVVNDAVNSAVQSAVQAARDDVYRRRYSHAWWEEGRNAYASFRSRPRATHHRRPFG